MTIKSLELSPSKSLSLTINTSFNDVPTTHGPLHSTKRSWRVTHIPNHVLSFPHIKIACSQPSQEIVVILTSHIWNVPHCCSQLRREREKERAETNTRWSIYRSIGPSLPTITITDLTTATLTFATSGPSPFPEPLLDRDLNHPRSHSCPCLSCVPLRKTYLRSTGRQ